MRNMASKHLAIYNKTTIQTNSTWTVLLWHHRKSNYRHKHIQRSFISFKITMVLYSLGWAFRDGQPLNLKLEFQAFDGFKKLCFIHVFLRWFCQSYDFTCQEFNVREELSRSENLLWFDQFLLLAEKRQVNASRLDIPLGCNMPLRKTQQSAC